MSDYYDRAGQPISFMEWAPLFENMPYRILNHTHFKNILLSTVWLGMNHDFRGTGTPIIFETMVFFGDDAGPMWRYSTEEAARQHNKTLSAILQAATLKKMLGKKWTRREQTKLIHILNRLP